MKDFLTIFIACFVLILIVLFFFGGLLFTNIWAIIILISLILSILIKTFISLALKVEELEKRIDEIMEDRDINN